MKCIEKRIGRLEYLIGARNFSTTEKCRNICPKGSSCQSKKKKKKKIVTQATQLKKACLLIYEMLRIKIVKNYSNKQKKKNNKNNLLKLNICEHLKFKPNKIKCMRLKLRALFILHLMSKIIKLIFLHLMNNILNKICALFVLFTKYMN